MKLKKKKYILNYFNFSNYYLKKKKYYYLNYYLLILSFFFKFLFVLYYIKKNLTILNLEYTINSNIIYTFKKKNIFMLLLKYYLISFGKLRYTNIYLYFKKILYFILNKLTRQINIYYINISKNILINYNISKTFFFNCNLNIFKVDYFFIYNIYIKENKIFGYKRLKKYPRKKKILLKNKNLYNYFMYLKKYKSLNNSMRWKVKLILNKYYKFKRLIFRLKKKTGRSKLGYIINKYKGGGVFYLYRKIDTYFYKYNYLYNFIGYDKSLYTTSVLMLLKSNNNFFKYIIAPHNFDVNLPINTTFNFKNSTESLGSTLPIGWIPNNTLIYNLETKPFSGGKLIKSGGVFGRILSHSKYFVKVLLPSQKEKLFSIYCLACVGRVSNIFNKFQNYGKAGIKRNLNRRPRVSCCSMNPYDHPNGGKTKRGKPTKNYWGKIIK